jgi:hypothetical protein
MAEPMSEPTFEQLRIPAALILIILAAFVFLPRLAGTPESATATPSATIVVGRPGGEVTSSDGSVAAGSPSPVASPGPSRTATPQPTTEPTPEPTSQPVGPDRFTAEVLACRSISGSDCNGQLGTLRGDASSFTALVRFTDANAGDAISVVLDGPAGTIAGGPYTLQGGGDGYYYSTFNLSGLPGGDYTVTASRNGTEVATTTFRRGG